MTEQTDRLSAALADRYRIERHLGAGGMANVYLAQDLKHDRKVAVKVLKPELAAVLGAERFVVEIKTTASLTHPHILGLLDSGTTDGFLWYTMPFIEGETLRDKLNRETQFGVDEAVRVTCEVADALDYAHRHGVIHRDIKPENILLHDGRPMVADFGIALAVSAAAGGRMTETGLSLGTPHYMSPEQATAEKDITARADIYSLASVLYEMLAGQPPHLGGSAQQIIMRIITDAARPVTELRKAVPPHVAAALARALEKLPADRFASAHDFREALMNPAFTTYAGTATRVAGIGSSAGHRRLLFASWAVAAVAVMAAVAGWMRSSPERPVARFVQALPDSMELTPVNGQRVAVSPDGRAIVFVASRGAGSRLWVRSLDALEPRELPGTEFAANPSFSPDSRRIAFVTARAPRALMTVSVDGGPVLTLTDSLVDLGGVSWGDDGYIYYDGHLEGDGVARIRENGGSAPEVASVPLSDSGEAYHFQPEALPGGRGFLMTVMRGAVGTPQIAVYDARAKQRKVLAQGIRARYISSGHILYVTTEGQMMAARFDPRRLELTGEPVLITDGVSVRGNQRVDVTVSGTGDLAYVRGGASTAQRELVWVARDGTAKPVDSRWTGELGGRPNVSPDGRRAVVATGTGDSREIWVKELDAGPATRVVERGFNPSWAPDGRTVLYTSPNGLRIERIAADGSGAPSTVGGAGSQARLSPDGGWVVYQFRGQIFARRTSGDTTAVRLFVETGVNNYPELSPDGRWLAYSSDVSGTWQVYVRPFPDANASRRQVSVTAGYAPVWRRDGRELFFLGADSLQVAPVTTGASFTSGTPRALFPHFAFNVLGSPPEVSADGQRFLLVRSMGAGVGEREDDLVLVQNFAAELRAKLPD